MCVVRGGGRWRGGVDGLLLTGAVVVLETSMGMGRNCEIFEPLGGEHVIWVLCVVSVMMVVCLYRRLLCTRTPQAVVRSDACKENEDWCALQVSGCVL